MYYVIIAEDASNSLEKRLANRPAHLARLNELQNQGRLCQQLTAQTLAQLVLQAA